MSQKFLQFKRNLSLDLKKMEFKEQKKKTNETHQMYEDVNLHVVYLFGMKF